MAKAPPPTEQRVVLSNISWQQFENLIVELGEDRQTRLTYRRGKLEMMTPVEAHQRCSKLIDSLILVILDELNAPITTLNPVTLTQAELGYATEPDACYYLEDRPPQRRLDLSRELPPDLLVEVALTRSNLDKLPIYAELGLPEVWRYMTKPGEEEMLKGQLLIYHLHPEGYVEQSHSLVFPFLPARRILEFLEQSDSMSLSASLRLLRAWVKEQLA
jgi:Uma2 family endonuclease